MVIAWGRRGRLSIWRWMWITPHQRFKNARWGKDRFYVWEGQDNVWIMQQVSVQEMSRKDRLDDSPKRRHIWFVHKSPFLWVGTSLASTLLYPVSLLIGYWDWWSIQRANGKYKDHRVWQLYPLLELSPTVSPWSLFLDFPSTCECRWITLLSSG